MLYRMIQKTTCCALAIVLSFICHEATAQGSKSVDQAYRKLADDFVASRLAWNPGEAVGLGLHEFDGKVIDLSLRVDRAPPGATAHVSHPTRGD